MFLVIACIYILYILSVFSGILSQYIPILCLYCTFLLYFSIHMLFLQMLFVSLCVTACAMIEKPAAVISEFPNLGSIK